MCDISRFQQGYNKSFSIALREIEQGRKTSHWIWWIFPTSPYLSDTGLEIGSDMNKRYAMRSDLEVVAFLWDPFIREKYIKLIRGVLHQCSRDIPLHQLLGNDIVKFHSHIALFKEVVSNKIRDDEILGLLQMFPILCDCQ